MIVTQEIERQMHSMKNVTGVNLLFLSRFKYAVVIIFLVVLYILNFLS